MSTGFLYEHAFANHPGWNSKEDPTEENCRELMTQMRAHHSRVWGSQNVIYEVDGKNKKCFMQDEWRNKYWHQTAKSKVT